MSIFQKYISYWMARRLGCLSGKNSTRLVFAILIGVLISFFLPGCQKQTAEETNLAFEKFTSDLFCQETASNTVNLHYTLRDPEEFGIREAPVTFGTFETDENRKLASVENIRRAMEEFDPEKLSVTNRLTFDVMDYYMDRLKENAEFTLYEEPLGLVSGIHTQLPVLLSEYQFYDREDVDIYLELMKMTPEYFQSLIAFEQAKSDAGLFMSDTAAMQVIEQCKVFMNMGESNYLITTFVDRIGQVRGLSEKEKSIYIQRNALMLTSYVLPAYSSLSAAVQSLMGTGVNDQGLCYFPEGKEYYEQVVKVSTGSERSVSEMKDLTKRQIVEDLEAMERALGITEDDRMKNVVPKGSDTQDGNVSQEAAALIGNPEEAHEAAAMDTANPISILNGLKKEIAKTFPTAPDTTVSVKYVPEALQGNLSPAFYMIPAIDSYEENVIYVNQAHMGNPLLPTFLRRRPWYFT